MLRAGLCSPGDLWRVIKASARPVSRVAMVASRCAMRMVTVVARPGTETGITRVSSLTTWRMKPISPGTLILESVGLRASIRGRPESFDRSGGSGTAVAARVCVVSTPNFGAMAWTKKKNADGKNENEGTDEKPEVKMKIARDDVKAPVHAGH